MWISQCLLHLLSYHYCFPSSKIQDQFQSMWNIPGKYLVVGEINKVSHFRFNMKKCFLVIFVGVTICYCFTYYKNPETTLSLHFRSDPNETYSSEQEIFHIIKGLPNLWGLRDNNESRRKNESVQDRVALQRYWVSTLGKTKFIQEAKSKKILVFTTKDFHIKTPLKCPAYVDSVFEKKCDIVTIKRGLKPQLKDPMEPYFYKKMGVDAVLFLRDGYWDIDFIYPEPRFPSGVQPIMYTRESPCHTGSARYGEIGAWSVNYWRGADVPIEPFRIEKVQGLPDPHSHLLPEIPNPHGRPNLVAGLISNCQFSKNKRLPYARVLQKSVEVHVYGQCGDHDCPTISNNNSTMWATDRDGCISHISKNYKFFLAFENCNCEDYVTEKFFVNAIYHGMVPIVMGARRENYELLAPSPTSFIHVEDFPTPGELADYLMVLEKDKAKYDSYFEWRKEGDWALTLGDHKDIYCRICGMLYYSDFRPPTPWSERSTRFVDVTKCGVNNDWRWAGKNKTNSRKTEIRN